ncbi:hypothetical protein N665_1751s0007 [Sinapis alba]|nr:hypothetical protein N665_1751s0007 [Sinapis alba]
MESSGVARRVSSGRASFGGSGLDATAVGLDERGEDIFDEIRSGPVVDEQQPLGSSRSVGEDGLVVARGGELGCRSSSGEPEIDGRRSYVGGSGRERVSLEGEARRVVVVEGGAFAEEALGAHRAEARCGSSLSHSRMAKEGAGAVGFAHGKLGAVDPEMENWERRGSSFAAKEDGLGSDEMVMEKNAERELLAMEGGDGLVGFGGSSVAVGIDDQQKHRAEKRSSSGFSFGEFGVDGHRRSSSRVAVERGAVEGKGSSSVFLGLEKRGSSNPVGLLGVDGQRRSSVVAAHVAILHRRDEMIEQGMGCRGLRWSSEGGLVDGFVAADFDEHGSNLGKEVRFVLESDVVVDDGEDIIETGPGSPGGLSMRDKLAAASKLIIDKEIVDESSSSSDSSSSESSSDSSSESDSVSSLSGTGDGAVDRVVGVEREGVIFQVAGSLSDPTSSCSSDEEPVSKSPGEDVAGGVSLDVDVVLEQNRQAGEDVGIVDERVGANGGGDEDTAASGEHGGVSAGEFSEVKGESFDFSYPSYVDCSSAVDLADGEMEQKIKRPRKKSCRMGPFLDHPRDSKSSTVTGAKLEWITTSCCTGGAVEVRLPGPDERPWTVPDGWVCLYDFWFSEYHLWFPLPRLLLAYCDERCIALSQLTPGSIRNVVGALVLAAECGVHMSLYFLEEIIKITPGETYGTFYLSMKSGRCFVREERRKTFDWIRRFFYARITSSSVSDMSRPLMTSWNPYHGYKECLAYVESIGIQNWKLIDRARVLRCVSFISSATWEVRSRMDFSEFPSLSECFAGGKATDVAAVASKSAGVSVGVGALASAPGVVVGLASAPASSVQSTDRRREGRGASEKSVVVSGKKGGDPKKRPADGPLAKEASSSKLRKVAVTTTDAPPPSGAPLVGEVSVVDGGEVVFQPFECAFGGTVEDCGELFKKLRMVGDDEGCPLDTSERSEWYIKYARHTTIAAKYVNRLVNSQNAELKVVAAELEKANSKLAAAKGGADRTGEIAAWRRKYEAERKVSFAAQEEVKALTTRMAVDAERAKKRQAMEEERYQKGKEMLRKRYDRAIARHDDVLATCNSRVDKVRRFVDDQKVVRQAMYGVNQIHGVLDAVKVWRSEGIKIPESKVKHLEGELDVRTRAASLVVPVAFEDKELALIPSFDFSVPLDPVLPSLTEGVEEAALAREKEEARRRSDVDRRRSSDREGTRRDGGAPSRS